MPDEGCRIRYRYDEAGNRTRREWQCWVEGEDPDHPGMQQHEQRGASVFDNNDLLLSPNPASDVFSVRLKHSISRATGDIMDMSGHVLRTFSMGVDATPISVRDLAEGTYAIRIHAPGELLISSFVVLR